MAVVSEFEIPAEEFTIGRVLTGELDVTVDVERVVPSSARRMPYHWVEGRDAAGFLDHVAASDAVDSVAELECDGRRTLYRIDWHEERDQFGAGLERTRATVLEARGTGRWWFRLRFPSRLALADFRSHCEDHGVTLTLVRVWSTADEAISRLEVTPEQKRTLELAVERGYFTVPREVTLSTLADELDISTQAASERLRRGTDAVLRSALLENGRP